MEKIIVRNGFLEEPYEKVLLDIFNSEDPCVIVRGYANLFFEMIYRLRRINYTRVVIVNGKKPPEKIPMNINWRDGEKKCEHVYSQYTIEFSVGLWEEKSLTFVERRTNIENDGILGKYCSECKVTIYIPRWIYKPYY